MNPLAGFKQPLFGLDGLPPMFSVNLTPVTAPRMGREAATGTSEDVQQLATSYRNR